MRVINETKPRNRNGSGAFDKIMARFMHTFAFTVGYNSFRDEMSRYGIKVSVSGTFLLNSIEKSFKCQYNSVVRPYY